MRRQLPLYRSRARGSLGHCAEASFSTRRGTTGWHFGLANHYFTCQRCPPKGRSCKLRFSMSHPISRLAEVCREHLLTEKIIVVPSLAIGHQIADAVAQSGTPWVNLRVETMRTLADAVTGFELAREGVTVLSRAQALAIIERACDRVLDSASYFAALADRPGLHRAIQTSIDDLRHAGIDPSKIANAAFEDPRKGTDVARILAAYDEELKERRYIDRFGVLARAIAMLKRGLSGPWAKDAIWIVVEDIELTTAEGRLLKLASRGADSQSARADSRVGATFDFRRSIGEENELRGPFRGILGRGAPLDGEERGYANA